MIGSGLKKLAKEKGMTVDAGVAYGSLDGFAATMQEGSGWKSVTFSTKFRDVQMQNQLLSLCNGKNLKKEYRIQNLQFYPDGVSVVFLDNPGTMKKIQEFLAWFTPLLASHGATGVQVCSQCGLEMTDGVWKLMDGVALHVHPACGEKLTRDIQGENQQRKENDTGSVMGGLVGALLGALLGSVLWAVVLSVGYVASIVGLVIGFLADKGYNLLKGKQSKVKVPILILATMLGVLVGTFGGECISLVQMISSGELPGFVYSEIPILILDSLMYNPDYLTAIIGNVAMGLLFAGLGIFGLVRKTGKEVADTKIIDLK